MKKLMDEARKNVTAKIVIGVPYNVGDTEFENLIASLGDMNRDNFFQYTVDVCKECENCGAVNDTVRLSEIQKGALTGASKSKKAREKTEKVLLCDWCVRDLIANGYNSTRVTKPQ